MDELFINKRDSRDNPYRQLQQRSIEELQRLSGVVWTDYNAHDPGVTLNDAVNYALTELDFRLRFDLPDYLATAQQFFVSEDSGLYTPAQVFPTVPVIADDYRKLLIDRIGEVENVWIYPEAGGNGWYEILVELSPVFRKNPRSWIENEVKRIYNRNRNLCEGLRKVRFVERKPLTMVADIEIEGSTEATGLLAAVYWEAQQFFIQGINYRRVEEALAEGAALDEILDGPELRCLAVCPDSLKPQSSVYMVPLLYKRLSALEGVKAVYSLYFTDGERVMDEVIESDSVESSYTVAIPSPDEAAKVRLRIGKTPVSVSVEKIAGLLDIRRARLYGTQNTTCDIRPFMEYPKGNFRPMFSHVPVSEDLPDCYGVNSRGLASDEPEKRKAQARQLSGYLQLFDGLFRFGLTELEQIPRLLNLSEEGGKEAVWLYRQELLADFRDRIYGENSDPGVLQEYNFYDEGRSERLGRRRTFQRRIPEWGCNRMKGTDLYDMSAGNVPGVKSYISALLGLEGGLERPVVNVFPLYNLKMVSDRVFYEELHGSLSHNFVLDAPIKEEQAERIPPSEKKWTDADFYDLKQQIPLLHQNLIFEGLFRGGVRADSLRLVNLWQHPDRLLVFHQCDGVRDEWVNLGRFRSRGELVDAAHCLRCFLTMLNRRSETLYVVEHLFLSPEEGFTLTVVLAGWSVRMADARFREGCEELVADRLPAHLDVRFRWLDAVQMWKFEKAYYAWRKGLAHNERNGEAIRQLKEIIQ